MTREQAEDRWSEIRQSMDGVIDYADGWTADEIDASENQIIEAVLDGIFGPRE